MLRRVLRSFALAAGLAGAAFAGQSTPVALGGDGTTYRLWSGTFGEIFGLGNTALPPATPILALDVAAPGQALLRLLVPGTEGVETESSAVLVYDASSNAVHLVWNTRTFGNQIVSHLALRSWSAAGWSDLTEISGGTLTDKTHLKAVLVHDGYETRVGEVDLRIPRRTLHLAWSENVAGTIRSYYSPVVFVGGQYLGWNPVVALDDAAVGETASAVAAPPELREAPELLAGATGKVVAYFVHSATQRLVSAEVRSLPGELGELAEMARGHIVELAGAGHPRPEIAEMARGHIVELARSFHDSASAYVGNATHRLVLEAPEGADGPTLGEMARGHIVELGREILDGGLADRCAADGFVLEIPPLVPAPGRDFAHLFAVRRVASWALPEGTLPGQRLLTAPSGGRAILAWEESGRLLYRETLADGGWSEVRSLDLALLPVAEAWTALAGRLVSN